MTSKAATHVHSCPARLPGDLLTSPVTAKNNKWSPELPVTLTVSPEILIADARRTFHCAQPRRSLDYNIMMLS